MAEEKKRRLDDDSNENDEDDEWIGPMPTEASKPKKKKGIGCSYHNNSGARVVMAQLTAEV